MSEDGRVFLRGISSEAYGLDGFRGRQRSAPRVVRAGTVTDDASVGHSGDDPKGSRTWWMLGPGDEPFRTQTLQVHFVELFPGGANRGHGHQNEALFYILEGRGHEIHDGRRYDWEKDDLVIVHNDSVHRHFNDDPDHRALALVMKPKSAWMYLGLLQQGRGFAGDPSAFGPPEDWTRLWTKGLEEKKKVVKPADTRWEDTRDGHIRVLTSRERTDVRANAVDIYQQEVAPGSRTAKHWHMADEAVYIMSGRGTSLQWDVEADIADRYSARIATEPGRWTFEAGDLVYVPQNTVHQIVNDGSEPVVALVAQNRLFKLIGYDSVVYLEDAPARGREVVGTARA